MTTYEIKYLGRASESSFPTWEHILNTASQDGWKLKQIIKTDAGLTYALFEKPNIDIQKLLWALLDLHRNPISGRSYLEQIANR